MTAGGAKWSVMMPEKMRSTGSLCQQAPLFVLLAGHVAGSAASSLTPRATIRSVPSGSGCCSFKASSGSAV